MKIKQKFFVLLLVLGMTVALTACFNFTGGGQQNEIPDECEHEFDEVNGWHSVIDATCSSKGLSKNNCTKDGCDYYITREDNIAPAAHVLSDGGLKKEPTCYSVGNKAYMICSECGYNDYVEIPVIPHEFDEGVCTGCGLHQNHEGLVFRLSDDGSYYILTDFGDSDAENLRNITLPSTYGNKPVAAIGDYAFGNCDAIECVVIPTSITEIGSGAFYGCTSLGRVVFETTESGKTTVTSFGESAFERCSKLTVMTSYATEEATGITIPTSVVSFGSSLFRNCTSLDVITLPDTLTAITDSMLEGCVTMTDITVPASVTSIGASAFKNCATLVNISFPDAVKGEGAVVTPSALATVGASAFVGCTSLIDIALPDAVTTIGESAFDGCAELTAVTLSNLSKLTSVSAYAFNNCRKLAEFKFPTDLSEIGSYAFENCAFESILIPLTLKAVGFGAFAGCDNVKNIATPFVGQRADGLGATNFGYMFGAAYYQNNGDKVPASLTKVVLTSAKTISAFAFAGCANITEISIDKNITSIGYGAFDGCDSLVYKVEGGLCYLGNDANPYLALVKPVDTSITSCEIDIDTVLISDGAFKNCVKLECVTFEEKTAAASSDADESEADKYIGAEAFSGCTNLYRMVITENVTSIGEGAFDGCRKLIEVYNKSSLKIEKNSDTFGSVALNALNVYAPETDKDGNPVDKTKIELADGFVLYVEVLNDKTVKTLVGYNGGENAVIPAGVNKLLPYALAGYDIVTLGFEKVSDISAAGFGALEGCKSLTSIELPFVGDGGDNTHFGYIFGAETYDDNAECVPASLKTVTVKGGNRVDDCAFKNCKTLGEVLFDNDTATETDGVDELVSIGCSAFEGCEALVCITVPATVTAIGDRAFFGCSKAEAVTFEENSALTDLGESAFEGCESISGITIPGGVAAISANTFKGCTALAAIEIPSSVTTLGNSAFEGTGLKSLTFAENTSLTTIGEAVFKGCASLVSLTIPEGISMVRESAFENCVNLVSVTVPASVTEIRANAFENCKKLVIVVVDENSSLKIVNGAETNGKIALHATDEYDDINANPDADGFVIINRNNVKVLFAYIGEDTDIVIPDEVEEIYQHAFENRYITSVVIHASVKKIGEGAFLGCNSLTDITVPYVGNGSDVTHFGSIFGAKSYRENGKYVPASLKSVTVNGGDIAGYAFAGCDNITNVVMNGVTLVSNSAFSYLESLMNVTVSGTVAENAFFGCESLSSVTLLDTVDSIGANAFRACSNLVEVRNASNLDIEKGKETNGCVALYALVVEDIDIPEIED